MKPKSPTKSKSKMASANNKTSIYAGDAVREALNGSKNKSARLESICARYAAIVAANPPHAVLTRPELRAVAEVAKDIDLSNVSAIGVLWATVAESKAALGKGVNPAALAGKLRDMTLAQRMALVEALEAK